MQVKVKNSCELKRYVSQNIRTIRSNSWNCTVNKFGALASTAVKRLSMREELRGDRYIRFGKSIHMWLRLLAVI